MPPETPTPEQPPRTDLPDCPGDEKLLEFAELDALLCGGKPTTEQMNRYDELSRDFVGPTAHPQTVPGVLARHLLEHHRLFGDFRRKMEVEISAKADRLLEQLRESMKPKPEALRKDPSLAILPSGEAVSLGNLQHVFVAESPGFVSGVAVNPGNLFLSWGHGDCASIQNPADIAAIRAALHNVGVSINAPTIAGEDRDGDGKTRE
jgi:hypothetical protein